MSFNCIITKSEIIITDVKIKMINGDVFRIPDYIQTNNFHNLSDNPYLKIDNAKILDINRIEWQWREISQNSSFKKETIRFSTSTIPLFLLSNSDLSLIIFFMPDGIPDLFLHSKNKSLQLFNNSRKGLWYIYRYVAISTNKELVFDHIEETLHNNTHDKLHDDGLLKYHEAGKPKKLAVKWHVKKSEYTAYFWFEDEEICAIFDKFYGAHRDTKTDFIIHIDVEKNKYELALYRYGLKEPHVIAENAYQLIVFKNKFECYRSENYDQPRGAWIW